MAEDYSVGAPPEERDNQASTALTKVVAEPPADPNDLYRLRTQVSKASSTEKLRTILDSPAPRQLVQSMPPQELLYTIKDIGIVDGAEVIELATKDQLRNCLDLDVWKKDKVQHDLIFHWMQLLVAGEIDAAENVMAALDPDVFVLYFKQVLNIYKRKEDEDEPVIDTPGQLIMTPGRNYIVEIPFPGEDPHNPMLLAAVNLFIQYGYEFSHRLFETMLNSLDSDLEERAYQFRKARVEEMGFVDYFDAIGIYQPLPPKSRPLPPSEEGSNTTTLPILATPQGSGLFNKSMQRVDSPETQARIRTELVYLNNKILSADQIDPSQRRAAENSMRGVLRTLDLGMEVLLQGTDPSAGSQLLYQHHVEWVFRTGFSQLAKLRRKANKIAREERFTLLKDAPLSLLGEPYLTVLQELRQLKPRFVTAIQHPNQRSIRPFRSLQEIQLTEQALETMKLLADLFFRDFGFDHDALVELVLKEQLVAPLHPEDIQFSHLFLTALAQFVLTGEFVLKPLNTKEVLSFLQTVLEEQETPPHTLKAEFQEKIETLLLQRPNTLAAEVQALQDMLRQFWVRLSEEASHLPLHQVPDERFLHLFLLEKPSA